METKTRSVDLIKTAGFINACIGYIEENDGKLPSKFAEEQAEQYGASFSSFYECVRGGLFTRIGRGKYKANIGWCEPKHVRDALDKSNKIKWEARKKVLAKEKSPKKPVEKYIPKRAQKSAPTQKKESMRRKSREFSFLWGAIRVTIKG